MINNLKESVELMLSSDYKDRFKAEYYQLQYRFVKLKAMLEQWDANTLPFKPFVSREEYAKQIQAMSDYMKVLERRAIIEEIDL